MELLSLGAEDRFIYFDCSLSAFALLTTAVYENIHGFSDNYIGSTLTHGRPKAFAAATVAPRCFLGVK